jgi:predicted PurR-regulated permease PerM
MNEYPPLVRYLIRLLFAFAVIAAFIITKSLLVPLFWSILFAYLLYPLADRMENNNIPRIATNFILIFGSIVLVAAIVYGISLLVISVTQDFTTLQENFDRNITRLRWALGRTFGVTAEQLDNLTEQAMSALQLMRSRTPLQQHSGPGRKPVPTNYSSPCCINLNNSIFSASNSSL